MFNSVSKNNIYVYTQWVHLQMFPNIPKSVFVMAAIVEIIANERN